MYYVAKKGDLVTVTIKDLKVQGDGALWVTSRSIQHSTRPFRLDDEIFIDDYKNVTVELSGKGADVFNPQPGDVYRDKDKLIWFVRKFNGHGGTIVIEGDGFKSFSDDEMNFRDEIAEFKQLNPTLIMRDGKSI